MQASADLSATKRLLEWYDASARDLPWRAPPGAPPPDPYRVWLSEVMLQQTTVAAVAPRYARFLERWPTVTALAAADDADVMAEWAGLGYYRRERNLLACAREVAARGGFPDTEAGLAALPGIGSYTAAAIASIAFGRRAVVVDANVERVVARVFAIDRPLPAGRAEIRSAAGLLTPEDRAGDFAQAMMDLGATICSPRAPRCLACPLRADCRGHRLGHPERFPVKAAKPLRPVRRGRAYWIEHGGAVWLVRRAPEGMLGGMRALPDDGWSARGDGSQTEPLAADWRPLGHIQHSFTHFHLEMEVLLCQPGSADGVGVGLGGGEWWPVDRLAAAGLPTLFAKAARHVLAAPGR
ncbi:MAG: A/G-specific adenine glycosylase [Novosphingobium sp.]